MRACTKCGKTKSLETGFYKHPFGRDGYQSKCIECTKSDVKAYRAARIEYYRAYDRQHNAGERSFWNGIDVEALIAAFIKASPRRHQIEQEMRERGHGA